uniref:Uncharacterized protein n=1 Tax=Tanacetum cinerariifolium TaxID=118510 RepID=A0A6L2JV52_TANCI|nr:hypothetical protein [Tanacetum cinerariifolium]
MTSITLRSYQNPCGFPLAQAMDTLEEEESSRTIKLKDLAKLVSNVQTSFKDLDSSKDDPIIVIDDSDENKEDEVHTTTNAKTEDTSVPKSSSLSSLPTELKDIPCKFNELTEEVKELKKQVCELEIKLPGDLKEIPAKLKDFTKPVTSLTSQVAELKTLQWKLPLEFLLLPVQVASVQAKLKTLDALPGQADTMLAEREKNTNQATTPSLF